ncbi:cyclic nucleotide-binding domain-containing protein [Emcibacter nanhaiensis]|nr:cyclic nucleotide-binding domain-containing protein [Emcibacter nanhaiensis]
MDNIEEQAKLSNLLDTETLERQKSILLRNELISNNQEIAEKVLQRGKLITFSKNEKVIEQGADDDCVYFILSGEVTIRVNKRVIDKRNTPYSFGEMAAKKAGETRTADVIVESKKLEAIVLSGTDFRKLIIEHSVFANNLEDSIDTLSRKKILQLGENTKAKGFPWLAISAIVGMTASIITGFIAWQSEALTTTQIIFTSLPVGLISFVFMLIFNPELRYRNLAIMTGSALIGYIIYGSLSFALTIDGKEVDWPLIDFSVHTEQRLGLYIVGTFTLLLLFRYAGKFDMDLVRSKK